MTTTPVYTPAEVAEQLRVSPQMVLRLAHRKQIGHQRVGRLFRFTPEHVAAFRAASEVKPARRSAVRP